MVASFSNTRVLESMTDAFFILDRDWRFTSLNTTAEKILGKTCKALLGRCIWEEFPELKGSIFEQEYRRAIAQQTPSHFEAFFPLGRIWVETRLSPYQDEVSVCLRNISERKSVEADLLEQTRLAHLEARISRFLVRTHSIPESLQYCTDAIVQDLDVAAANLWLWNEQSDRLELQGSSVNGDIQSHLPSSDLLTQPELSLNGSVIGAIAKTRQPVCDLVFPPFGETLDRLDRYASKRKDVSLFCNLDAQRSALTANKLYFVGYPLVLEEELIGVLAVWSDRSFSRSLREGFEFLADNLALDIDRIHAKSALASRREALLFRLANQIRNSLDLDTILQTAVREIRALLKVDCCAYLWCWSNGGQPSVSVSHEDEIANPCTCTIRDCPPEKLTVLAQQIEKLQPIRIDDINNPHIPHLHPRELEQLVGTLKELNVKSVLLIPLKTHSNHFGAIACTQNQEEHRWSDREVELLEGVVDQLALAIDQAEMFAQTRATALAAQTQARELQLTLQELRRTQAQLIQTEKMSSLGQMIAGIAHEINNPVNFISGNLSYTSEYVGDVLKLLSLYKKHHPNANEEVEEFAEDIDLDFILEDLPKTLSSMQIGAERIRQIVLSLRNFSRLDQAEMKAVDIHEGIDSTLLILHNRLKAKGDRPEIQIVKEYGDLPKVECYAGQLNQVFMNILSNGIDALDNRAEPRCLTITTEAELEESPEDDGEEWGNIIIRIRDNGSGMSEQTRACIFDPFFTTKPVGKGTGLGLAISYQIIVEKHRGTIECRSAIGEGTEFYIKIPLRHRES